LFTEWRDAVPSVEFPFLNWFQMLSMKVAILPNSFQ